MPIVDLQRRMAQLGEIRMGHVVAMANGKTRPEKLDRFRFTSPSKPSLEAIAGLYGGTVQEWTPANGGPKEWEVFTDAERVPVLVPPNAISQWYELYAGSRCVRRCDGNFEQKTDVACLCDPERRECSITTRLNVMLRDVPGVGVWLLTTRGYYAAIELPPLAELLAQAGGFVNAWLGMEEKRVVRDDSKVNRFMVPKLYLDVTPAQLLAGGGGINATALEAAGPVAAIAGRPDYIAEAKSATTTDQVSAVWRRAGESGHLDDALKQALQAIAAALPTAEPPSLPDDPDVLWQMIVAAAPSSMSMDELEQDFAASSNGVFPGAASVADLQAYVRLQRTAATS